MIEKNTKHTLRTIPNRHSTKVVYIWYLHLTFVSDIYIWHVYPLYSLFSLLSSRIVFLSLDRRLKADFAQKGKTPWLYIYIYIYVCVWLKMRVKQTFRLQKRKIHWFSACVIEKLCKANVWRMLRPRNLLNRYKKLIVGKMCSLDRRFMW